MVEMAAVRFRLDPDRHSVAATASFLIALPPPAFTT
jgi:hypothetical protein